MKRIIRLFIVLFYILIWTAPALGAAEEWKIEPVHSNVYFDIRHTYATVRGMFNDFSGKLILDPDDPNASNIEFTVQVDSINTHINNRDNHLRSDEFFDAAKFPVMTFKSTGVKEVKGNQYIIEGDLTIKDVTKKITVPFIYYGMKENPLKKGQMVAGFESRFTINRLDYHVGTGKFADMGVVGKDVNIVVTVEALHEK